MIRKTQWKFFLIAMAAVTFSVLVLIAVINYINTDQTDRVMRQALQEMADTVNTFHRPFPDRELNDGNDEEDTGSPERSSGSSDESPEGEVNPEAEERVEPEEHAENEENTDNTLRPDASGFMKPDGDKKIPWWAEDQDDPDDQDEDHGREDYFFPGKEGASRDIRDSAMGRYAGRLSMVSFSGDDISLVNMSRDNPLSEGETAEIAEKLKDLKKASGRYDDYYYLIDKSGENTAVWFLDGSAERDSKRRLLLVSSLAGLGGILLMGIFVWLMSKKAMAPLEESTEKQKRFITDAGHELKTPLSVIATNMDLLEMENGKSEWIDTTRKQVGKLRSLVQHLVSLSKLEEADRELTLTVFSVSEAAEECCEFFSGPAELSGKELKTDIEPGLSVKGDYASVSQILTILLDNAVKYAKGDIDVRLYQSGKKVVFETENDWEHSLSGKELDRLFDRFYRADESRSKQDGKEGYGLGLSIASAAAAKNHASISAEETGEGRLKFTVSFKKEN
ncbi:MAG: hypothetical protein IJL98_08375 [Lachnospiraceae bacterium]|nr:hypothetical protein [Lachnospiraceae bacterium]